MLQYIDVNKIYPHKDNPRKDLGDLTELVESIKANGVLQNLTVVPREDGDYTVIIGHRRLAASKLAGLDKVPCVVADMDEKEQVATMLTENMQRSDLTVVEQAEGIQMMFDFGETVETVSERTGLSKTTIQRRKNLLKYDREKVKQSFERGGTLSDYMELEKIKDLDRRSKVLDAIGTSNFQYRLQSAIDEEKAEEYKPKLIELLSTFATEVKETDWRTMSYIAHISFINADNLDKPNDAGKRKYYYVLSDTYVSLYAERKQQEPKVDPEQQRRAEIREKLDEVSKRVYKLRNNFVRDISPAKCKAHVKDIIEFAIKSMIYGGYLSTRELAGTLNLTNEDEAKDRVFELCNVAAEKMLLLTTYSQFDNDRENYFDWQNNHEENEGLDLVYDMLCMLGYEMSDEEKALQDGTHELFESEGDDES